LLVAEFRTQKLLSGHSGRIILNGKAKIKSVPISFSSPNIGRLRSVSSTIFTALVNCATTVKMTLFGLMRACFQNCAELCRNSCSVKSIFITIPTITAEKMVRQVRAVGDPAKERVKF